MQQLPGKSFGNRSKANIILGSVFIVLVLSTILKLLYPADFFIGLLSFTAECAMVGGIADWFAVTALFREPLGFPWHTAIIPKNKDMLAEKVSELVGSELLSVEAIRNSLQGINLADSVIGRITENINEMPLENRIMDYLGSKAESFDREKISEGIDSFIKENLKKEGVSEEIRSMLVTAFNEGRHGDWLMVLLDKAIEVAGRAATREKIYMILKQQEKLNVENTTPGSFFIRTLLNVSRSSKHSNLFNVAKLLQDELLAVLVDLNHPDNPLFQKISESSSELISRLDNEQVLVDAIQTWKNGILDKVDLLDTLNLLVSSAMESNGKIDEAAGWITEMIDGCREELGSDEGMRKWLNDVLKNMLEKIISNEHHMISEIVHETLESFTNDRLIRFVEEKTGEDLQWIRINGSIVGSIAGIAIYLFTNLFYSPFVVPVIHKLLGVA